MPEPTPARRAELRALLPDEPWRAIIDNKPKGWRQIWTESRRAVVTPDGFIRTQYGETEEHHGVWMSEETAALIVAAVNALPALLDIAEERDRLRAELAKTPAWLGGRLMALNTVRLHHGLLSGEFTSLWEKTLDELAALAAVATPEPQENG